MLVVLDTNVLVSALWSKNGAPAKVVSMVLSGGLVPCFDYRILCEYQEVLRRPKFGFSEGEIRALLGWVESFGYSVIADPVHTEMIGESDRKFYEVAHFCNAVLITGNRKHYPEEPQIVGASDFLREYESRI